MLHVAAWKVRIGRSVLYLLDSDLDGNAPWDRELTGRLYGGDQSARLLQEIILGIGGVRVLRALGIHPTVWHANEGHTALMMVERVRELVAAGARIRPRGGRSPRLHDLHHPHAGRRGTRRLPVPARGNLRRAARRLRHTRSTRTARQLYSMATHPAAWGPAFNMTALALRLSGRVNGVSRRHGEVSRAMWQRSLARTPRGRRCRSSSITNGVHVPTWISGEMDRLYQSTLSPDWLARHDDPALWDGVAAIPDESLWEVRRTLRPRSSTSSATEPGIAGLRITSIRARRSRSDRSSIPAALTIGFARRFATYKRAALILRDPARLHAILTDPRKPVQIIFAGKAHPADEHGKEMLQSVYRAARDPAAAGRIAFLEDYDMHAAHWLDPGRRPLAQQPPRAAGSVRDERDEGGDERRSERQRPGRLVGGGVRRQKRLGLGTTAAAHDASDADARDAEALYRLLAETIVPLYYDRDARDIPAAAG